MFLSDKPVLVGQRWTSGWLYSYQQGLQIIISVYGNKRVGVS